MVSILSTINLHSIKTVTLTKIIREEYKLSLYLSHQMAKGIIEAHRLGVIRGQVVNSLSKL
jgi:hypothetical protein